MTGSAERLPGFDYRRVDIGGVTINGAIHGSGPPVLMLHGYPKNHLIGFGQFQLASHDRGARVAHRLVLDHAGAVTRLAVLDIVPTQHRPPVSIPEPTMPPRVCETTLHRPVADQRSRPVWTNTMIISAAILQGGETSMADVQFSRQEVVQMLLAAGFGAEADEAMRVLPDPVALEHVQEWAERHGITRDVLISRMGGSP